MCKKKKKLNLKESHTADKQSVKELSMLKFGFIVHFISFVILKAFFSVSKRKKLTNIQIYIIHKYNAIGIKQTNKQITLSERQI